MGALSLGHLLIITIIIGVPLLVGLALWRIFGRKKPEPVRREPRL